MPVTYLRIALWYAGAVCLAALVVALAGWIARRRGRPLRPWRVAGWVMTLVGIAGVLTVILAVDFLPVLLTGAILLASTRRRPLPTR